jgi:hypothetical protein
MEFGPYVQDTWRLSPRLTLSAGLRWDKWTVYKEKYDRLVNLDLTKVGTGGMQVITPGSTTMESIPGIPPSVLASWAARGLTWTTAKEAGFPSGLLPANNNNFAPRLGLAFRLNNKTVLRAGYGVYYWTMPLSQILQSSRSNPPLNLLFQNDILTLNGADGTHAVRSLPAANEYLGAVTVNTQGIVDLGSKAQSMMPLDVRTWGDNRAQEWTLTFERELMRETSVRLSYIGNHGSNLEQRWFWNSPEPVWNYQARTGLLAPGEKQLRRANPNWDDTTPGGVLRHNGYSNTNSLQAEVERRFAGGLAFQGFYTFTRALTTTDAGGATAGTGSINGGGSGNYLNPGSGQVFTVPQNIQVRGEPTLTDSQLLRFGYANSTEIPAHHVRWNGLYDLPFGKGRKFGANAGRGLNLLLGGWQLSFLGEWRCGYWMGVDPSKYLFGDPSLSADQRLVMNIFGKRQRLWFRGYFDPTRATGVDLATLEQLVPADPTQRIFRLVGPNFDNKVPQTLANGTVPMTSITDMLNWNARSFFRGPGSWNHDMSVFKTIPIGERFKLRVTADFFNALNHPNDLAPDLNYGLQDLSQQANDPRIVQFSMRLSW